MFLLVSLGVQRLQRFFSGLLDEMLLPKLFGRRADLLRVAFSIADLVHLKDGKALASVDGETDIRIRQNKISISAKRTVAL